MMLPVNRCKMRIEASFFCLESQRVSAIHNGIFYGILMLLMHVVHCSSEACDLQDVPDICNTDLLSGDTLSLEEEARRTAHCLLNNSQPRETRVQMFKCLLDHVDHLLPEQDQHFEEAPEHGCVLCQVFQLYNCEKTLAHAQCGERFISQLKNIQKEIKSLEIPQEAINSWVQNFLDVKNWDFYRFRETSSLVKNHSSSTIVPAYVYGRDDGNYMDKLKEKVKAFFIRVGGFPGFIAIKILYCGCLLFNCILVKIIICHNEMFPHTLLLNIALGDVLNLLIDNFVAVFLLTHWYPGQITVTALVYFNYAVVALQIYTIILYSFQRRFPVSNRKGIAFEYTTVLISVVLWTIAAAVPAPICLMTMSAKNGILYCFTLYVLIPVICIIILSKERPIEPRDSISHCQACSQDSSSEKMFHSHSHLDKTLQTERWVQNNPAETSFDSEINSGETIMNSDTERHDSMEESALNLQQRRCTHPCIPEGSARSQGARFQKALATVYVLTYVPAICLYLALYFAIKREEFISYRRLCVYLYAMLNPLAMYIADKALRRMVKNTLCCCRRRFQRKSKKLPLG